MNAVTEMMPEPLVFTENAANKVRSLIEEEGNEALKLRVFVSGGGCSQGYPRNAKLYPKRADLAGSDCSFDCHDRLHSPWIFQTQYRRIA